MLQLGLFKKRGVYFHDYLPWASAIDNGVVLCKDGSFIRTIIYHGPDLDSSNNIDLVYFSEQVNGILKDFSSNWVMYFDAVRTPMMRYPICKFDNPASYIVHEDQKEIVQKEGNFYETKYYLTIQYLPSVGHQKSATNYFFNKKDNENVASIELQSFLDATEKVKSKLNRILNQCRWLETNEIMRFLHLLISNKDHEIAECQGAYLDVVLPDTEFVGGLNPKLGEEYLGVVTLTGLPNYTCPGLLELLNSMSFSYRWNTRFLFLSSEESQAFIKTKRRHWYAGRKGVGALTGEIVGGGESPLQNEGNLEYTSDLSQALAGVQRGEVGHGFLTSTIVIKERDQKKLTDLINFVQSEVGGVGCPTIHETINSVDAFFGSLAGNPYANVRQLMVNTKNLSHVIPLNGEWTGIEHNKHLNDAPLFIGRIPGGSAFRTSLHDGDVGHTMVVGPTGAGKSVLLSYIALSFKKYKNAQVFFFDKGNSAKAAMLSMGGVSTSLALNGSTSVRPLEFIDNDEDLGWAVSWISKVLENEKLSVDSTMKREITEALKSLRINKVNDRTLSLFLQLVQNQEIRDALAPYAKAGIYGNIFDSDTGLALDNNTIHFEMGEILKHPNASLGVMEYLFHSLGKIFRDGKPSLLILDEAWLLFDNEKFSSQLREWLKTLRKLNVSVIFATQSLDDLISSKISSALIESCPTRIFLPNQRAKEPNIIKHYQSFGLSEREIEIISNSSPKKDYYFHSRLGQRRFELGLGSVALAICTAGNADDLRYIGTIEGRPDFLKEFLKYKGFDWAGRVWDGLNKNRMIWCQQGELT